MVLQTRPAQQLFTEHYPPQGSVVGDKTLPTYLTTQVSPVHNKHTDPSPQSIETELEVEPPAGPNPQEGTVQQSSPLYTVCDCTLYDCTPGSAQKADMTGY